MAEITKIEFWNDVGFIDGAVEIPALSAADPINPDITLSPTDPIIPSKDRFFSEIKIKAHYSELLTVSYMRLTIDLKNSLEVDVPHTFYGWVDSVELVSDGSLPNTVIRWHIDEWRTWKSAVTFGSGHIKRRPYIDQDTTPIQNYPVRYYQLGTTDVPVVDNLTVTRNGKTLKIWWMVISLNITSGGNTVIETLTYPIILTASNNAAENTLYFKIYNYNIPYPSEQIVQGPNIAQCYSGMLDELLTRIVGVAPNAVNGIWISPIPPIEYLTFTGSGTTDDPMVFDGAHTPDTPYGLYVESTAAYAYCCIRVSKDPKITPVSKTISPSLLSTEQKHFILCGPDGQKIIDLPYGIKVTGVHTRLICEPDGPYLEISFIDSSYGNLIGLTSNVPLMGIPLGDNAYASYVYSGQQEYDREMRVIQSNANAWKSTTAQTAQGAMLGTFGPQGLIIGAAGGLISGLTGYGVEMLYQNDEEQRIEDRLQASQPSSLILSSNALLGVMRGYGYCIKEIDPDAYSAGQIASTRTQFGISVDELVTSCDTFIRTSAPTGYYNIQNLIISGDIPVSAKRWIREKFRAGVRLV